MYKIKCQMIKSAYNFESCIFKIAQITHNFIKVSATTIIWCSAEDNQRCTFVSVCVFSPGFGEAACARVFTDLTFSLFCKKKKPILLYAC